MRWVWHLSSPQTFHFRLTGDWAILCTLARSLARDESAPAPPPHLPLPPSSLFSKPTVHHYPHPGNNNEQRVLVAKKGPRRQSAVEPNSQFVPFFLCFPKRKKTDRLHTGHTFKRRRETQRVRIAEKQILSTSVDFKQAVRWQRLPAKQRSCITLYTTERA